MSQRCPVVVPPPLAPCLMSHLVSIPLAKVIQLSFLTEHYYHEYTLAAELSASKYGMNKIWLDPNRTNKIANANSRQNVRKLLNNGLTISKPGKVHSKEIC